MWKLVLEGLINSRADSGLAPHGTPFLMAIGSKIYCCDRTKYVRVTGIETTPPPPLLPEHNTFKGIFQSILEPDVDTPSPAPNYHYILKTQIYVPDYPCFTHLNSSCSEVNIDKSSSSADELDDTNASELMLGDSVRCHRIKFTDRIIDQSDILMSPDKSCNTSELESSTISNIKYDVSYDNELNILDVVSIEDNDSNDTLLDHSGMCETPNNNSSPPQSGKPHITAFCE